jgi:ankyrin repeat protein
LPESLDETYERTLQDINKADSELAHRLFQCVAVASRPLRVAELAEFLALDFEAGQIPIFREDWRPEDPLEAVLSTCSTLLSLINIDDSAVIQFSHYSVREFLTSPRFAEKGDTISRHYHVSLTSAHSLVTQACLGILLQLDENITSDSLDKSPLAEYAAKHWVEHARFEGVSQNAEEWMKPLFDPSKPHLAVWLWIYDPIRPYGRAERPSPPCATPLHYAAYCGLHAIVKFLVVEHPQDVNSQDRYDDSTPLHLASEQGSVEIARTLIEHGADLSAKDDEAWTPLHRALSRGHMDIARLLVECGADVSAKGDDGWTPLHLASTRGNLDLTRFLIERGADVSAEETYGWTPLHRAASNGHVDLARFLVEGGADVSAKDQYGWTPLNRALSNGHIDLARYLAEYGGAAKSEDGSSPLHMVLSEGHVDLAWFLVEHGADVSARDAIGSTPLHWASSHGHGDLVQLLVAYGADVLATDEDGRTPLDMAYFWDHMEVAQFLIDHGADATA